MDGLIPFPSENLFEESEAALKILRPAFLNSGLDSLKGDSMVDRSRVLEYGPRRRRTPIIVGVKEQWSGGNILKYGALELLRTTHAGLSR